MKRLVLYFLGLLILIIGNAHADVQDPAQRNIGLIKPILEKKFFDSRIELQNEQSWNCTSGMSRASTAQFLGEDSPGKARFQMTNTEGTSGICQVQYRAFKNALIAKTKIKPGDKLLPEHFETGEILVSGGEGRDFRTLLMPIATDLSQFEAMGTVLPGRFLLLTQVKKIPLVKRGDTIRVEIGSGQLRVVTQGLVQQDGQEGEMIRVTAGKAKREVVGRLKGPSIVEVQL